MFVGVGIGWERFFWGGGRGIEIWADGKISWKAGGGGGGSKHLVHEWLWFVRNSQTDRTRFLNCFLNRNRLFPQRKAAFSKSFFGQNSALYRESPCSDLLVRKKPLIVPYSSSLFQNDASFYTTCRDWHIGSYIILFCNYCHIGKKPVLSSYGYIPCWVSGHTTSLFFLCICRLLQSAYILSSCSFCLASLCHFFCLSLSFFCLSLSCSRIFCRCFSRPAHADVEIYGQRQGREQEGKLGPTEVLSVYTVIMDATLQHVEENNGSRSIWGEM